MADILIKGMEMPDRCGVCDLYNPFFDTPYCRRSLRSVPPMGRPEWCPLGEVPTHGRLVDADELAALCDAPYWCVWLSDIRDAPTVIEASEGGEQDG